MDTNNRNGVLLALLAASLWGVSGTFGQFLFENKGINVEWLITMRLIISGLGLLLLAKLSNNDIFFHLEK